MSTKMRAFFISLSILALVAFSAMGTIPVYADDGTTTGPTETTPTGTDQGTTPTTTASDPSTTGDVQPPGDGTTPTAETTPDAAATPLLEQVPDNTTVTVVDATTGEVQPLASQDSAAAVLLSDPIWCPAGQAPTPGANGCTASYSNFTDLLNFLKTNEGNAAYQVDGTIYVQQGNYTGSESSIDFNSYNFTQINKKNLTVTGGWNPADNSTTSTSNFTVPITIGSGANPWGGSLTLNNLLINGAATQTGLTLYSTGDVALSNVEVSNSQAGVEINAGGNVTIKGSKFHNNKQKGANITSAGNVDVTDSQFNANSSGTITGAGLGVKSTGSVTLLNIEANNNQLFGSDISAGGSVNISQSFFSGNQSFTGSLDNRTFFGYGLQVVTPADIGIQNIFADNNSVLGAHLEGSDVVVSNSSFSSNGSNTGLFLIGEGLEIKGTQDVNFGRGDVSLTDITADNNKLFGADINTTGFVTIGASLKPYSSFSGQYATNYITPLGNTLPVNGRYGLKVVALTGEIALAHVKTINNFSYGTSLEGTKVTISDGIFSSNGSRSLTFPVGYGLKIVSTGIGGVTLKDVVANNNQMYGADIKADANVDISASTNMLSTFTGNMSGSVDPNNRNLVTFFGYGLTVNSLTGDITLNHVEGNFNNLWGGSLDGMNIFVSNSQFNNNVSDSNTFIDDTGLLVNARGNLVFLDTVEAKNNRLIGATIKDDLTTSTVADVYILNSTFTGNAGITCATSACLPGGRTYHGYGLNVVTPGLISLDGVNASNNNLFGANLEGSKVKVVNSTFSGNVFENGLTIKATADVLLSNVTVSNNGANGVQVTSTGSCVQVVGGTFTGNTQYGISVSGSPVNLDGAQTFGGNGSGDYPAGTIFGTCVADVNPVFLNVTLSSNNSNNNPSNTVTGPVVALVSTTSLTTLSAGTTENHTTVSSDKKHKKAKKAYAHHRRAKVRIQYAKRF